MNLLFSIYVVKDEKNKRYNVHEKKYEIHEMSGLTTNLSLPTFVDLATFWKCQLGAIFATEFILTQFVNCELSPAYAAAGVLG